MGLAQLVAGAKQFINPTVKSADAFSNPEAYYRVVRGQGAFDDIVQSGTVRTQPQAVSGVGQGVSLNRDGTTMFPSFAKGKAAMAYAQSNPDHYIIETTSNLMAPSTVGRHSKGSTMFPTDPVTGKHLKELPAGQVKVFQPKDEGMYTQVYPADRDGLAQRLLQQAQKARALDKFRASDKPLENQLLGF